jgi:hypothetical protein
MHMAPRAAAWVAWVEWTCNTGRKAGDSQKRAGYEVRSFFCAGYFNATRLTEGHPESELT